MDGYRAAKLKLILRIEYRQTITNLLFRYIDINKIVHYIPKGNHFLPSKSKLTFLHVTEVQDLLTDEANILFAITCK